MKTKLLLCIVFLCGSYGAFAQINQVIIYDFAKGEYEAANIKPTRGKNVIFKIKNINPFFSKITTTPHDIEFDTNALPEPPKTNTTEEKNVQLPKNTPVDFIGKSEVEKITSGEVKKNQEEINEVKDESLKNLDKKIREIDREINNITNDINESKSEIGIKVLSDSIEIFKKQLNDLEKQNSTDLGTINNLKEKLKRNEENTDKINNLGSLLKEKNQEKNNIKKDIDKLKAQNDEKEQLILIINKGLEKLNKNYGDFFNSSSDLVRLSENYQNFVDKIMDPTLTQSEFKEIIYGKGMERVALIDEDNYQRFYDRINKYEVLKDNVTLYLEENTLLHSINILKSIPSGKKFAESIEDGIKDKVKTFNTITQKISQLEIRRKLNYVETVVRKLKNPQTYEMTSQPIQPWGDYLEFDVQISERKSLGENYFLPNKSKFFKYSEFVRGGVRFDFSLGTVFDFGLKENTYEVIDTNNATEEGYTIKQLSDNKYTPIIAAMFHSSIRSSTLCSLAFTLGVSVDPSKLQIESLFPGLSLMVGKKDKIVFTAGPSFRRVNELNDIKYEIDQFTKVKPTDYMIESFKIGFFVGVSWSLTAKQKNIIKIPNQ